MYKNSFGALFAVFIIILIEAFLHTDTFLLKYRSVFAAGRAMDKLNAITELPVETLLLGNSRVDNGFSPTIFIDKLNMKAFNLGIPGANAEVLFNLMLWLDKNGELEPGKIKNVLIGLDESIFQPDDSLGYLIFFSDRYDLLKHNEFKQMLMSSFRLIGYEAQLKDLREPEKFVRFVKATFEDVKPLGGAAIDNLGFRPGERDRFQNEQQLLKQESGSKLPPDSKEVEYFFKLISILIDKKIKITVFFPPLLNRDTLFFNTTETHSEKHINIKQKLIEMDIPIIHFDSKERKNASDFANAGHLNTKGSKKYTGILIDKLEEAWPNF